MKRTFTLGRFTIRTRREPGRDCDQCGEPLEPGEDYIESSRRTRRTMYLRNLFHVKCAAAWIEHVVELRSKSKDLPRPQSPGRTLIGITDYIARRRLRDKILRIRKKLLDAATPQEFGFYYLQLQQLRESAEPVTGAPYESNSRASARAKALAIQAKWESFGIRPPGDLMGTMTRLALEFRPPRRGRKRPERLQ